jgi:hypothetical protein
MRMDLLLDKIQNTVNESFTVFRRLCHVGIFPRSFIPSTNGNRNFKFRLMLLETHDFFVLG